MKSHSQCLVRAADYAQYWQHVIEPTNHLGTFSQWRRYVGPERRANAHDRRFYHGQGGRRRWDRKS